jgi:hypothetical protein
MRARDAAAYLQLGVDTNLLVTGVVEEFACPTCHNRVRLELPPPSVGRPREVPEMSVSASAAG